MHYLILFSFLVYFSFGPDVFKNYSNNQATIQNTDFTKTYEGNINHSYAIKMTLTKKGAKLSGTYHYKSKGKLLKLDGNIDNTGKIHLKEFDNTGNMTGIFDGQLKAGTITGYWKKPDASKIMPFSVSEIKSQKQKNSLTGNYVGEAYQDIYDDLSGQFLIIKQDSPDSFYFTIDVDKSGNCSGFIDGTAILNKGIWEYSEREGCILTFKFGNKQVELEENEGCVGYHGASCSFVGNYYKK